MKYHITIFTNLIIYYHKLSHFSLNNRHLLHNKRLQTVGKSLLFPDKASKIGK
jgi:hypothetical protein